MLKTPKALAWRVSFLYAGIAIGWIFLSSQLVAWLIPDAQKASHFEFYKDTAFVVVAALLLFYFVRGQLRRLEAEFAMNRKRAEALREKEALYHSVFTAMAEGLIFHAANGKITAVNPAAEKIMGHSAAQMMGRTSDDLQWGAVYEDGRPFPGELHPAMVTLRTGQPQSNVVMGIHQPDGTPVWISINSQPLTDGKDAKPCAVVTTFHDITKRRQMEEAMRNVLRHARTIVMRHAIEAPAGWEGKGVKWAAANFRWEKEIYDEVTAQEVLPVDLAPDKTYYHGWGKAKHQDDLEAMGLTAHRALLAGASNWKQEFRCIDKHGRLHWFNQIAAIEPSGYGRWQVTTFNTDITERKLAEDTLRASMIRLIQQESALIALNRKEFLQDGDLLTALRRITEISARTLDVARVSVWRFNPARTAISCVDLYELPADRHSDDVDLAVADYPAYFQALAERDVIVADDACESQQTREFAANYLKPLGITSMMDAPINLKGVMDGVICLEHIGPQRSWTTDERTFVVAVANSVSLALEEWERRQAEKAFRQSQQAYAALVNTVDGIVWEADAQTFQFLFVSQMAERLLGYPIANWLNAPTFWQDHLHPEDRDWAVNYCVESTRRKEDHDFRYRMIAADGRVVWVHDLVSVVVQADQPVKLRGIMVDITEQKRAEETLRRQTALFAAQVDSTIDGILIVDNDGKKLLQNQRNREIWKIPREIAENKDDSAQLDYCTNRTKNPKQFIEKVQHLYSHPDEVSRDEIELVDGTVLDRYSAPVKDQAGKYYGRIWTFRDITESKRAGAQAQHLANFPELNPNPVLEFTADGKLAYHNPAATNMAQTVGYPSPTDLLPPGTPQIVAECLSTGQPRLRLETTQNQHTLSWSFYPILTERVVHCYVGDITERKQLEEQFRQSQKMEAIGQLSGGVAHDFNNILCVILGHASLLQMGGLSPGDLAASAQQIAQSAERAANLTRQLLAFSRRQIMQSRPLDLNETTAGMIKMLQRLIGEHIVLQTRYAAGDAFVQADSGMIEQVLLNLAVNARDAMPDGGEISIQTEPVHVDAAAAIKHPNGKPGDFIRLSVRDTGCGIPAEHLPRIFEPFFTTKEVGKGTGLGLATVFGIVEQHHGWIEVESEPGRGTAFHIYLPRLKDSGRAADQPAPPPVRGGPETILMVEDEPTLHALTRNALERYGYRVIEATSGRAALKVWQQNPGSIQLLLTDLIMPEGVSGRELATRLQAEQPQLKVVYMSGYPGDVAGQGLSLREGVNFLQKPFSPVNLAKIVRTALDAK